MKKIFTTTRALLVTSILVSVLVPSILINLFYYQQLNQSAVTEFLSYQKDRVERSADDVQALVEQIDVTARQLIAISISSDQYTRYNEKTPGEKLNTVKSLQSLMQSLVFSVSYDTAIYYIGTDDSIFGNLEFDAARLLEDAGSMESGVPFVANYYPNSLHTRVIPFLYNIQNYNSNNFLETIGIDLQYADLERVFAGNYEADGVEVFIVSDESKLIYALSDSDYEWAESIGQTLDSAQLGYIEAYRERERERVTQYVSGPGWTIHADIRLDAHAIDTSTQRRTLVLILAVTLCFALVFSYFVSKSITRPINSLIAKMRQIGKANSSSLQIYTTNKDIMVLSDSFDEMLVQIERLNKATLEKEKERVSMQLRALRAQINPHFLYNTLEDIRSIALENNVVSIAEMTKALARTFRYSISKGNIVTVKEELAHIEDYAQIQRYRHGENAERFNILYYIDDAILECRIVKFILQPLIENAISHGIEPKKGKGVITVVGSKKGGEIEFRIIDNGIGMEADKLRQIQEDLANKSEPAEGIGLINVDMRLNLYYGARYGIAVESLAGEGTQITVTMPFITGDYGEEHHA